MPNVFGLLILILVLVFGLCGGATQTAIVTADTAGIAVNLNGGHNQTAGAMPPASSQIRQPGTFIVSLASARTIAEVEVFNCSRDKLSLQVEEPPLTLFPFFFPLLQHFQTMFDDSADKIMQWLPAPVNQCNKD